MDLSRREAVHWLTVLVGGAISAPTLSAIAAGCRAGPRSASWTPQVLDAEQLALLEALVDRIIPPTDTPGANEAGVAVFIDELLSAWVDPDERDRFLRGLQATGLGQATPEEQDAVLAGRAGACRPPEAAAFLRHTQGVDPGRLLHIRGGRHARAAMARRPRPLRR